MYHPKESIKLIEWTEKILLVESILIQTILNSVIRKRSDIQIMDLDNSVIRKHPDYQM